MILLTNLDKFGGLFWGWRKERLRQQILGWPKVVGRFPVNVVQVEMEESSYNGKEGPFTKVPYTYVYQNRINESYSILHPELYVDVNVWALQEQISGAQRYWIWVNPAEPREAYLSLGESQVSWKTYALFFSIFLVVPIVGWWIWNALQTLEFMANSTVEDRLLAFCFSDIYVNIFELLVFTGLSAVEFIIKPGKSKGIPLKRFVLT